ncbi:unnamed protein product [Leptidea sinapis]|uniref:Uncharacterized protein n=1 Tax=Leptidea sinapis TaxID=189913 RepID=A0A5E4PQQ2_9NEOP|nr:unnamed protein product [Leptidea sinapis]
MEMTEYREQHLVRPRSLPEVIGNVKGLRSFLVELGEPGCDDVGGADLGFLFVHLCLTPIMKITRTTMRTLPPPTAADIAPDIWNAVLGRSKV